MSAVPSVGRADAAALGVDATRVLYERYSRRIFAYCVSRLGDRSEAEDAMQTTFLNAFRSLNRGVVPEFELAWLFRIAENVCRDGHKSTSRRRRLEATRALDEVQDVVSAPPQSQDGLVGLTDALARMPERQRRAILLREWQGLSYGEIARELDLSMAAVETLIFRARRSLARGLEGRRASGFNVVSLLAAARSFLQGGAAAKVAATAVAVASVTLLAGLPLGDAPRSDPHTPAAVDPAVSTQTSARSTPYREGGSQSRSPSIPERAARSTSGGPSASVPAAGASQGDAASPTTASGEREPGTLAPGGDGSTSPANPPPSDTPSLGPVPGLLPVSPPAVPGLPSVPELPPVVPPPPAIEPPALPPLPDSPVSGPEVPPLAPLPPLP